MMHRISLALTLAILSSVSYGQSASTTPPTVPAYSKPSQDVTLTFSRPGRIAKMIVKEGDRVEKGQELAQLDDREERAQVAIDKSKAEDTTPIQVQEKIRDQKQVNYKRYLQVAEANAKGVSPLELDAARIDALVEEARVAMATMSHEQDVLKYEQTKVVLQKCTLVSPFAGWIEEIHLKDGESVDGNANSKVVRVVNVDPLWIDASVPLTMARQVKTGDSAQVKFPETDKTESGRVIFVGAVADAASETVVIRIELPNPNKRLAGEQVNVIFPTRATAKSEVTR